MWRTYLWSCIRDSFQWKEFLMKDCSSKHWSLEGEEIICLEYGIKSGLVRIDAERLFLLEDKSRIKAQSFRMSGHYKTEVRKNNFCGLQTFGILYHRQLWSSLEPWRLCPWRASLSIKLEHDPRLAFWHSIMIQIYQWVQQFEIIATASIFLENSSNEIIQQSPFTNPLDTF